MMNLKTQRKDPGSRETMEGKEWVWNKHPVGRDISPRATWKYAVCHVLVLSPHHSNEARISCEELHGRFESS